MIPLIYYVESGQTFTYNLRNFAYVLNKSSLVSVKKINHDISKVDLNVIEIKVTPLRNRAIPESCNIIVE